MYADNCVPVTKDGVKVCTRLVGTAGVDGVWLKAALARQELLEKKLYYGQRRALRLEREASDSKQLVGEDAKRGLNEALEMEDTPEKENDCPDFVLPEAPRAARKRLDFSQNADMPDIPVRIGYRTVDPRICQILVDLESKFGIEGRRSRQVLS